MPLRQQHKPKSAAQKTKKAASKHAKGAKTLHKSLPSVQKLAFFIENICIRE